MRVLLGLWAPPEKRGLAPLELKGWGVGTPASVARACRLLPSTHLDPQRPHCSVTAGSFVADLGWLFLSSGGAQMSSQRSPCPSRPLACTPFLSLKFSCVLFTVCTAGTEHRGD